MLQLLQSESDFVQSSTYEQGGISMAWHPFPFPVSDQYASWMLTAQDISFPLEY